MKFRILPLIILFAFSSLAQVSKKNIDLLGNYKYTSSVFHGDLSDIWGYVDSVGNEYAIVGLEKGVSIVDVTDPNNLNEVFYVSGVTTIWRDIKTWNKHAYITNEKSGGLMIIDMSSLPGSIVPADVSYFTGSSYPLATAHNIYIDENGVAYIFGYNKSGGAIFLDLTQNPKVPIELGRDTTDYYHDGMARGDTLWASAVNAGYFKVVDVSNKAAPVQLANFTTTGQFTHNCWISDNGKYLFTTDEISNGFIDSYDVSDLGNIDLLDFIQSSPGDLVIPHNTHVIGDFLVTSYYRDGVTIHDASYPDRLVEVGHYDSSPLTGDGFNGCWGAYPWLPSGNLIISDIEEGLFVLGPEYVRGAYLEGNTKKFSDSSNLGTTSIVDSAFQLSTSNLNGFYKFAFADSGLYRFVFRKSGYLPDTVEIQLSNGQLTERDVYLRSDVPFGVNGRLKSNNSSALVGSGQIRMESKNYFYKVNTALDYTFIANGVYEGEYEITGGIPGYWNSCIDRGILNGDSVVIELQEGFYDDFTFDFGWDLSNQSGTSGLWEIDDLSRLNHINSLDFPTSDVNDDCSGFALVTGKNSGVDHDVDGGSNTAISFSIDASGYNDPLLKYSFWFKNDAPSGQEDTLEVALISGSQKLILQEIHNQNNPFASQWVDTVFELKSLGLEDLSDFKISVRIADSGNDHLLEAAMDHFRVEESYVGIADNQSETFNYYPNPATDQLWIERSSQELLRYEIFKISGRRMLSGNLKADQNSINVSELNSGLYLIRFIQEDGQTSSSSLVIE